MFDKLMDAAKGATLPEAIALAAIILAIAYILGKLFGD